MREEFGRRELARFLERFAAGDTGPYEWDDVMGIKFKDPDLERIRGDCWDVLESATPDTFAAELLRIAKSLQDQ